MKAVLAAKSSYSTDQCEKYKMAAGWLVMTIGIKMQVSIGRLKASLIAHSHQFGK
jgi:hypothetical protein